MSLESSAVEASVPSRTTASNATSVGDDNPPSPSQLRTALESSPPSATGPGDSPPLPKIHENLLNDGIADQISRRAHRRPIVVAALLVLAAFTLSLTGIVATLGTAFYHALKPENIAKFAAVELQGNIDTLYARPPEKPSTSSKSEKASSAPESETKSSKTTNADEHDVAKGSDSVKVEAKIYGEIRDSMVPFVALVSILAVAIVVILGTMLKAAFAPHPNNSSDSKEKEETSPVPLLEALKSLVESVRAAFSRN